MRDDVDIYSTFAVLVRIDVSHTIPTIIIIKRISIISVLAVVREFFRVSLGIAGLISRVSHTLGRYALPQLDALLVLMSWIVENLRIGDLLRFQRRVNVLALLVFIVFYVVRNDLLRFLRFFLTLNSTGIHQATGELKSTRQYTSLHFIRGTWWGTIIGMDGGLYQYYYQYYWRITNITGPRDTNRFR